MKKVTLGVLGLLLVICGAAGAKLEGGKTSIVKADQIKWVPSGTEDVEMAVVEGDQNTGPHHMFVRFKPGVSAPMHFHHADHYVTVVSGTLMLTVDGKEQRLPQGSYFSIMNEKPHATTCESSGPCVLFLDVRGKWDVIPAEPKVVGKNK